MSTIRGVKDRRFKFVQLLNTMFEDEKLSLKAKGFIGYCLTKKDDWKFHVNHLCTVLKEGEKAIYSVINECIEHGYAYRYQPRQENGDLLPVETIVSDSKVEIAEFKKEIESDPNFKKCLPLRPFGEPILGDAIVAPDSNTVANSNMQKKQQQAAAAPLSNSFIENGSPRISPKLHGVNIPPQDKFEIAGTYDEKTIDDAIDWALDPKNPPKKCLAASIKFACKNKLVKQAPPEDVEAKNKSYAMQYNNQKNSTSQVVACNTYVEVSNCGVNGSTTISYKEKGFIEQFVNALRKNNFKVLRPANG